MYLAITHPPCADCAGIIIQAGIRYIVFEHSDDDMARHNADEALELFNEAKVQIMGVTFK